MTDDAGRPIRSDDFRRHRQQAERRFAAAEQASGQARQRAQMAELALLASGPERPPETRPGDSHVLYRSPVPGAGSQRVGPFVTGQSTHREAQLSAEDIAGEGELQLLRPGGIWAKKTQEKRDVFEARLQPARLMEYDALMIPVIAGQVSVELFSDQGSYRLSALENSRLVRFDRPKTFNGRVRVESESVSGGPGGGYIHTMGGLGLYRSDWAALQNIRCPFQAPEAGTIQSLTARYHPTGEETAFALHASGGEVSLPYSAEKGEPLELKMEDARGRLATSLIEIELTYQ